MTITCLHNINIQTDRLEETRDFYERILGLYVGARPDFGSPGYWLFAQGSDHPIVHLSERRKDDEGPEQMVDAGNRLDHVAFFGRDLDATLKLLKKEKVDYDLRPGRLYLGGKMAQVFVKDPNGINVEMGFFPETDAMFAESMAEYQKLKRKGDRKLKTGAKPARKTKKARETVSA
jgi:catechol 2,3-dioxygenase-like lactoylglutathione lyase family enzyme